MAEQFRSERTTQDRVIGLFTNMSRPGFLGYRYLGNWKQRENNRPIETEILESYLAGRGYSAPQISAALHRLFTVTTTGGKTLYQTNLQVYSYLRYGIPVQVVPGKPHETVKLIDWEHPEKNDFALAEEVTLRGAGFERRPDIVLYVNGIAVAVLELKRGSIDIADGIRQLRTNQEEQFNTGFFSTAQFLFAGNDSQGLRYGTIGSPEEFFVEWKHEQSSPPYEGALLDKPLAAMCEKNRLLDLMRNFITFDGGRKKVPRPHQYIAVKAAQERIRIREGGVIWHTQGSGKSILMVLLAKWILENFADARILIITDRDELDKQIEGVMRNAGVVSEDMPSFRITSRSEFTRNLGSPTRRILCALLHKFEPDLTVPAPPIHGQFYVFVDECHRTQGGAMNKQMKQWLKNALFIGFTGTPLLRKDKQTTRDVFGTYIHTYKFQQAVADEVVLDLKYEARDVPQRLTSREAIDDWFNQKTKGLNNFQRSVLRQRWATMETLMSAQERKQRIIASIIHDFAVKPRLNNDRGTALLVAASIYDACHYYRLLLNTPFGKFCGIVTSFQPDKSAISTDSDNSDERYKYDTYTQYVLTKGQTTKQYEDEMKRRFRDEPANCKLLIVVSKLLTGFDAPSCTYIYLDNEMKDHNLFQAICRTNRLDGPDKEFGYIIDFKELFEQVQNSIAVYSSDALDVDCDGCDGNVTVKDWLKAGKEHLDETREALRYLCEPVLQPREMEQYIHYFCGDAAEDDALAKTEQLRIAFYKAVVAFVRAYAAIAQNLSDAGYTKKEIESIEHDVRVYTELRAAIKKHSGEELDTRPYEADMRHLINTYIQADPANELGSLSELSLTELIIQTGIHDAIARRLNASGKASRKTIAEGIINNIRKTIIREQLTNAKFYAAMSQLLADLIKQRRDDTDSYQKWLESAESLARKLGKKQDDTAVPPILEGNHEATVIYNNIDPMMATNFTYPTAEEELARLAVDIDKIVREEGPAGWQDDPTRGTQVQNALYQYLDKDRAATEAIFKIVKNLPGYK